MLDAFEGKDLNGFVWIQDPRNEEYYYLKDFEHLIAMKVNSFAESLPLEHWEAIVFEDESCQKIVGRADFATEKEAKESLERLAQITLKNRKI